MFWQFLNKTRCLCLKSVQKKKNLCLQLLNIRYVYVGVTNIYIIRMQEVESHSKLHLSKNNIK